VRFYPNRRNATIGRRIFTRDPAPRERPAVEIPKCDGTPSPISTADLTGRLPPYSAPGGASKVAGGREAPHRAAMCDHSASPPRRATSRPISAAQ
jgi:hypothetical protein